MAFNPPQPLPTGDVGDDAVTIEFARQLAEFIGPGYQPANNTLIAADLLSYAYVFSALYDHQGSIIRQSLGYLAGESLPDWELRLGLPVDPNASTSDRRAAIQAKLQATGGASALRMTTAVTTLAGSATLYRNISADVAATDPRAVFRFAFVIPESV
jgi:uncharacterized protein YmfQ (DUF2313 family)